MINRRGLITGLISLVAAPAIVRATSLMPVKAIKTGAEIWEEMVQGVSIDYGSGDRTAFVRWAWCPITERIKCEEITFEEACRQDSTIVFDMPGAPA